MKALLFLIALNVTGWSFILLALWFLMLDFELVINRMKSYLQDLMALVIFIALVSAAYSGISYMVTGEIVTPTQLRMALR